MQIISIDTPQSDGSFIRVKIEGILREVELKRSHQGKINEAIWQFLWDKNNPKSEIAPMDIVSALEKGGLKIVEK